MRYPGVSFPDDDDRQRKRSLVTKPLSILDKEGLTSDDRVILEFADDMFRRGFHDILDGQLPFNEAIARVKSRLIKAHLSN